MLYSKSIANDNQNLMDLADGLKTLNGNVPDLSNGVNQLDDGINQIYAKVVKSDDAKSTTLASGIKQLYDGIESLKYYTLTERNNNPDLPDGIAQLNTKMAKLLKTVQSQNTLMSSAFMSADLGWIHQRSVLLLNSWACLQGQRLIHCIIMKKPRLLLKPNPIRI